MNSFKDEVRSKIKKYSNKEYLDGYIKNEFLTSDGNADILLRLKDNYELLDYRTIDNQLDLCDEVYDYIEDKSSMLENDIKLKLNIIGLNLDEKDKGKVKHIIKEHYAIELYKTQKEYRRIMGIIISLLLFGFASLFIYSYMFLVHGSKFLIEVFGFMFSLTLWKAAESYIYDISKLKYKRESIAQRLLMDISFEE